MRRVRTTLMRSIILVALCFAADLRAGQYESSNPSGHGKRIDWGYAYTRSNSLKVALPLYAGAVLGSASNATGGRTGSGFGFGFDFWYGTRDWSFEIDILFLSKGYTSGADTFAISYIQIPLLIRRTFWRNFSVNLGPYFAPLPLSASQTTGTVTTDVGNQFNGDYGVTFGLRYTRRIKNKLRLGIDVRYDLGLFNVLDGGSIKLKSFNILATLEFGLW